MSIVAPGRRINPTVRRKSRIGRKQVYAGLFLTSMVDMFAIMVIFLLQSFSSEGELIVLPQGFELPKAENTGILERAPSLVVALDKITLEGQPVADTGILIEQEEWALPELMDALKAFREKVEQEALLKYPNDPAKAKEESDKMNSLINISGDRRLPFQVMRKAIYNAGKMGYNDSRFAVFGAGVEEVAKPIDWTLPGFDPTKGKAKYIKPEEMLQDPAKKKKK